MGRRIAAVAKQRAANVTRSVCAGGASEARYGVLSETSTPSLPNASARNSSLQSVRASHSNCETSHYQPARHERMPRPPRLRVSQNDWRCFVAQLKDGVRLRCVTRRWVECKRTHGGRHA
jgi:hypothetical protein